MLKKLKADLRSLVDATLTAGEGMEFPDDNTNHRGDADRAADKVADTIMKLIEAKLAER